MRRRRWSALVVGAAVILRSGATAASPEFPEVIRSHEILAYTPACTLCHASENGGAGTAVKPFARSAIERGLRGADDDSLRAALDAMRRDRVDSDGDGMADIDELVWGTDPNVPDVPRGEVTPTPTYGCSLAPSRGGPSGVWSLTLVIVASGIRRRHGKGKESESESAPSTWFAAG
jgi:hypothetical protein